MESSSSEEERLSDAEVQKVEEVAFRTAAAEASGNAQEARVIKDAAQPTPRQVQLGTYLPRVLGGAKSVGHLTSIDKHPAGQSQNILRQAVLMG